MYIKPRCLLQDATTGHGETLCGATENAEGGFHHTCAQLSHAFNVNYHAMGMHMAKKRELQSEWRRMLPTPGQEFASLAINMGLDAKKPPPRTESELQPWWQKEIHGSPQTTVLPCIRVPLQNLMG